MQPSKEEIMETIILDLNYLGESSQRELDAYRNIGSVASLSRLKRQEIRRHRRMRRCKAALEILVLSALCAFGVWVVASWIDIILHNTYPNPVYQIWNFFTLFS